MSDAKCIGHVSDSWSGRNCDRDLKTNEQIEAKLCGRHLAGKRRRAAAGIAFNSKQILNRNLHAKAENVVTRLKKFGVESAPHYSTLPGSIGYTGRVVIRDGEALADLLEESS